MTDPLLQDPRRDSLLQRQVNCKREVHELLMNYYPRTISASAYRSALVDIQQLLAEMYRQSIETEFGIEGEG